MFSLIQSAGVFAVENTSTGENKIDSFLMLKKLFGQLTFLTTSEYATCQNPQTKGMS